MFFDDLYTMFDNAKKLDPVQAWLFSVDNDETKEEIIRLNTEDQLEEQGVDRNGVSLGGYALFTITEKIQKGQRYDHVTLKDTGAFYNSFVVEVTKDGFSIIADDVAFYDRPLTESYGLDILGLTTENEEWLGAFILDKYQQYAWENILR